MADGQQQQEQEQQQSGGAEKGMGDGAHAGSPHGGGSPTTTSPTTDSAGRWKRPRAEAAPRAPVRAGAAHFPLSPCILGPKPPDDLLFQLVRFLKRHLPTHLDPGSVVEVEGKLGVLLDTGSRGRIELPVTSETLMDPGSRGWYAFEADVGPASWERCRTRLQHVLQQQQQQQQSRTNLAYPPMTCREGRTLDSRYEHQGILLRVTRAQSPEAPILECVSKRTIASLDIFNPASPLDMRISINLETHRPPPPGHVPCLGSRAKERTSFVHELFRVDLTRATTIPGAPKPGESASPARGSKRTWEVEVEVVDARVLVQSPSMTAVVEPLLNHLRALSRLAVAPGPPA